MGAEVCAHVCRCTDAQRARSSDLPERNLQAVVSHMVEVLGTELRTSTEQCTLSHRVGFLALRWAFDHNSDHFSYSSLEKIKLYWVWLVTHVIPCTWLRQEGCHKFEASLG